MIEQPSARRKFLFATVKAAALFTVANTGVYTIGSAFKSLDGSMVAGAKTWNIVFQTGAGQLGCSVVAVCPVTAGTCGTLGATKIVTHCGCEGNGPGSEWSNAQYQCN